MKSVSSLRAPLLLSLPLNVVNTTLAEMEVCFKPYVCKLIKECNFPTLVNKPLSIGHHKLQKSGKPRGRKRKTTIVTPTVFERPL